MNRIDTTFETLRSDGRKGLMPFLCAGFPGPGVLPDAIRAVSDAGATTIEIGFPFSDPIADGPVIAAAMHRALEKGCTLDRTLDEVRSVGDVCPLVAMVTMSIIHRIGEASFLDRIHDAGFSGIIVPDLPGARAAPIAEAASSRGLTCTLLVAPTTPEDRIPGIVSHCSGFVYLMARTGITGARDDAPEVEDAVSRVRSCTELPIACGFGISTAAHVRAVHAHADAAIVGSALVRAMDEGTDPVEAAGSFTRALCSGDAD